MSRPYIACIADAVDSRDLPPRARAKLQDALRGSLRDFNKRYRKALAADFAVTLGDELQCLLLDARRVWEISHHIRHAFPAVDWIVACGKGAVTTKLRHGITAPEVDGPCFHAARAALEQAKEDRRLLTLAGFDNQPLEAFTRYYSALYWSWTANQRREANRWRFSPDAPDDGRHPTTFSHLRRRLAWPLVEEGDTMFRAILEAS